MSYSVLLADDHQMFREGICHLFESRDDLFVVGEAGDGRTAVQMARKMNPQVVIMDVSMPGLNGIEATRQILADNPEVKVVALSMHSDRRFVLKMLKVGASGYLLKDSVFDELIHAIQAVIHGKTYLSPEIAGLVLDDYRNLSEHAEEKTTSPLSPREREVVQLIAEGQTSKQIAEALNVSTKTIETHRAQVMRKLNVHNLVELTKYAIREGLTSI
ncbi:two component transcriptional regulator, LuxR family [Desulfuromusa kysingii]|uniref:Two component transcriptional regulator, LuxR family n=1 Tax=Desulfuromusa kysingii TaxID=37625 RepID=A0A1H4AV45_9BACT|nr:response regulator transcription factor [Desulfuromusa kysingii]SEA39492.1 two component transcriptional regulator, LuxR family [Desulfuromusa kysingii]